MARKFYNEFSVGFEMDSPYMEDIQRLGTITNRKQLEQNDIITTFKVISLASHLMGSVTLACIRFKCTMSLFWGIKYSIKHVYK